MPARRSRRNVARPGVLSLNIREKAALYAAYMPFLQGRRHLHPDRRASITLGEEVFMLLSLMDDPNRIAVQGKVVWITPEGVQGNRTQGIGVQFTQDETGAAARADDREDPRRDARFAAAHAHDVVARGTRAPGRIAAPAAPPPSLHVRRFALPPRFSRLRRRPLPRCSTRWRRRGSRHALCIARQPRATGRPCTRWRPTHANLYATVGVHPDYAGRRRAVGRRPRRAARARPRWSRSARPGSTTTA